MLKGCRLRASKKKITSTTLKDHVTKMLLFKDSEQLFGRRAFATIYSLFLYFQALFQTFDSRQANGPLGMRQSYKNWSLLAWHPPKH